MSLSGQHEITFTIDNYEQDTVVVGYYMIDKQLVHDTILKSEKGNFVLEGEDNLESGVYMLLVLPEKEFVQFIVSPTEQKYQVHLDKSDLSTVSYKNSPDNSAFQKYVRFLKEVRPQADILRDTIKKLREAELPTEEFEASLLEIDTKVFEFQNEMSEANPDFISSQMLLANKEIVVPDFADSENPGLQRYLYYRDHYFDYIDLGNPDILRTPFLHQRIDYFLNKLTTNHPDSINVAMDFLLERMEPAPETFKYYLSHYLNHYSASKLVGYDAIYVYLVDNYYAKGKAPWVEEDNLIKIVDKANRTRPTLIGKIGADLEVYGENGDTIVMSEIDYEYLVLVFWAPDCGHCKKSMPKYIEFNERWAPKGVKTLAICTKLQDKTKTCWDYIKEKKMEGLINAVDTYHDSRFKIKYNVVNTPKVYILDKNREILIKHIGVDQLDEVLDQIIEIHKNEQLEKQ